MDIENITVDKITIPPDFTLKEAMQKINEGNGRVLFVTGENNCLVGTVTDGDIRRAILNNVSLDTAVENIMYKSPHFVSLSDDNRNSKARAYMLDKNIQIMPVLGDCGEIVGVLFWQELIKDIEHTKEKRQKITTPVVIMAGGKGTRLDPFTRILPKPLIPIGDKPIIELIMETFYSFGFENFFVTLNYKKEFIKAYFHENKLPYSVEWIEEDTFLGTAGSLSLLKGKIKEPFFVTNCDIILKDDLREILSWHRSEEAKLTVVSCHKELTFPYGVLEVKDGRLKNIQEKPIYDVFINTGVYIIEPEIIEHLKDGEAMDMPQLIKKVAEKDKVSVFPFCSGWFDTGEWGEYRKNLGFLEQ